jgi:hypothetical protein
MGSEASNNIYREPKFVAQVIRRPENDMRRAFSKLTARRLFSRAHYMRLRGAVPRFVGGAAQRSPLSGVTPSFALRRLTVDGGLLPLCAGPHTASPIVHAAQPLTFALRGRALAFVRALLAFVGHPLTVVRYAFALVGHPVSSPGLEFASCEVGLAASESVFALIELVSATFQLGGWLDTVIGGRLDAVLGGRLHTVLGGHSSP